MLGSSTTSRSRAAQRGGGIIIDTEATTGILSPDAPEEENFKQLINQIWKNSFTKYELIPSDSTGGFLYKITLAEPESRYFKKLTAFNFEPVRELLLKVVIISENKGKGPQKKRFSKAKDFIEESFIQTDVYNQSYDEFLEPICPFILLSQIVPNADLNRIINYIDEIMTEENKEFVEKIREISGWEGMGLDVGFIFMEYLEGSFPLSKYFPAWNSNNYKYKKILDESSPNDQIEYLKLYIYELVRLWMAGYIHDDTHLDNAMYIANPDGSPKTGINYIYNKRLYLIDFGHAEKHKEDINNTRKLINRILPKINYWSYSALKGALKEICEGGGAGGIPEKNFEMWYHEMTLARNKSKESYIDNIFKNPVAPQYKAAIKKLACAPPQAAQEITRAGFADIFETNGVIMRQDTIRAIKPNDDKKLKKPLRGKKYVLLLDNFTAPLIEVLIYYVFDKFIKARNDINIFYNRIPDIDGVYTFVVYKTANGKINTVCYKTHSFHEIATKHACVMYFENIVDYYSAGELKVEGANIYVNYLSGTYMGVLIKDGTPESAKLYEDLINVSNHIFEFMCKVENKAFIFEKFDSFITKEMEVDSNFFNFMAEHLQKIRHMGIDLKMFSKQNFKEIKHAVHMDVAGGAVVHTATAAAAAAAVPQIKSKYFSRGNIKSVLSRPAAAAAPSISKKMQQYNLKTDSKRVQFSAADIARLRKIYDDMEEDYAVPSGAEHLNQIVTLTRSRNLPILMQSAAPIVMQSAAPQPRRARTVSRPRKSSRKTRKLKTF